MNWKKPLSLVIIVALVLMSAVTLPSGIKAYAMSSEEGNQDEVHSNNFTYNEMDLFEYAQDPHLSDEEIKEISKLLDDESLLADVELAGIPAIIGAIAGVIAIVGATYAGGKYAARNLHTRGILTTSHYKKWRWLYRPAIISTFGPVIALGFDDYHYGV